MQKKKKFRKKKSKLPQNSWKMFDSAIPYQKHKCINVIKHQNKIQRDMSRKHQIQIYTFSAKHFLTHKKQVN